jgi:hypothetical protein
VLSNTAATLDNAGGTITVDVSSELDLQSAAVDAGTVKTLFTDATHLGLIDATGTSSIDDATINNAGTLEATAGTLTLDHDTITNSGLIEATTGGKIVLSNTAATLDNAGGTITVDVSSELDLQSAVIDKGQINNSGIVEISNAGNELDDVQVANHSNIEIFAGGVLTLDQGTSITNDSNATVIIDASSGPGVDPGKLVVKAATISGGTITDNGSLEVTGTLTLQGGMTMTAGTFTLDSGSEVQVESSATLNNVVVTGGGTIIVDTNTVLTTLYLGAGFSMTGGALTIHSAGAVDVTGSPASLSGVTVTNENVIEVLAGGALTLQQQDATHPTTVDNSSGTITIDGSSAPGTTPAGILTLGGATITGGIINDYSLDTNNNNAILPGTIDVTAASTITAVVTGTTTSSPIQLTNGTVNVGAALTLDNVSVSGTQISETSSGSLVLADTVKLTGGVSISGFTPAAHEITNNGTLEIAGPATLSNDVVSNVGTIQVDDTTNNASTSPKLTLSNAIITGGIVNNSSPSGSGGTIAVTGATTLQGVSNSNKLQLNKGTVSVGAGLTLNSVVVSASQISQASGGGGSIEIDNTVQLTAAATILGLAVTNTGTLEIKGGSAPNADATLNNVSLGNSAGTLQIDDGSALVLTGGTSITGGTINDYTPSTGTGGTISRHWQCRPFWRERQQPAAALQWHRDRRQRCHVYPR